MGAPLVVRGPPPEILRFFLQNFTKKRFFHIFKMKLPKSEEKINIGRGAPEKLGGPPKGVPPPHRKSLAAPLDSGAAGQPEPAGPAVERM